jgi:exo-beta-1,3-glucanase (GH17 family)
LITEDLISAVDQSKTTLTNDGITLTTCTVDGVDVSSGLVIGQALTAAGKQLAAHFTPHGPVMENIYGFQFGDDPVPAVQRLSAEINEMETAYPDRPAMVGEPGWATAGADSRYPAAKSCPSNATPYFNALYPCIQQCGFPTLVFESYDQPAKGGSYLAGNNELAGNTMVCCRSTTP